MKTEIAKTANNTGLWDYYISLWKDDCTYRGISVNTVSVWEYKLRYLQRYTHVDNPLNVTVANIKNWSNRGVKLETRRSDLNAIRSFYNFLYNAKYLKYPIVEDLPMLSRRKPKRQIIASWKQISESISKHQGENIELMIRLAAEGGLRRNEIARVNSKDIVLNNGNYSLLVHGKGDKERLVPLSISLAQLMLKRPKGWLFPSDDPKHSGELLLVILFTVKLNGVLVTLLTLCVECMLHTCIMQRIIFVLFKNCLVMRVLILLNVIFMFLMLMFLRHYIN